MPYEKEHMQEAIKEEKEATTQLEVAKMQIREVNERFLYSKLTKLKSKLKNSDGIVTFDGFGFETFMEEILITMQTMVEEHNHSITHKLIINGLSSKNIVEDLEEADIVANSNKGVDEEDKKEDVVKS